MTRICPKNHFQVIQSTKVMLDFEAVQLRSSTTQEFPQPPPQQIIREYSKLLLFVIMQVSKQRNSYPFCIVWTILPCLSWFLPWIGHTGICNSKGQVNDFLGYHINKGKMAFGDPVKYVQLDIENEQEYNQALRQANQEFSNQGHDLCCNNCHHHVARVLNILRYQGKENWSQVSIWWMCLANSSYFSCAGILQVYLPLLIITTVIVLLSVFVK